MTKQTPGISRAEFDQILARAITLDAAGTELLNVEQARAIAAELGVSDTAWEIALCEQETARVTAELDHTKRTLRNRLQLIALAGAASGALSGALGSRLSEGVAILGAFSVVIAVALMIDGLRHRSVRQTQTELATWWGALVSGIFIGLGQLHVDPIVFVGTAWSGSALLTAALDRFRRKSATIQELVESEISRG